MAGLKLMTQGGYVPRVAPHLLQDNEGQRAINTKLYAGDLRSWFKPKAVTPGFSCIPNGETIFKGKTNGGDAVWIVWDSVTNVTKNPIVDETQAMSIYYTEGGVPKKTNSALNGTTSGQSPADYLTMGVAFPTTGLTATKSSATAATETRVYAYTYIQEFGGIEEESAPSLASNEVGWASADTIDLTDWEDPSTLPNQNITKVRIYRSVPSTLPTFLFVDEIDAALLTNPSYTYTDSVDAINLGEQLPSLGWVPPPTELYGLVAHPSGFLAGFNRRTIYLSEIAAPHAFPVAYQYDCEFDIVALGIYGQSIVVLNKGNTIVLTGIAPEQMTPDKITELEPCVSARSVVSDTNGVMYASPNGLCLVGPGGSGVATGNLMLRDEFSKFNPATIRGAVYNGKYFGFYMQGSAYVPNGAFILDRSLQATPLSLTNVTAMATYVDPETSELFYLSGTTILQWEGDTLNNTPFEWLSKRFIMTAPINFAAVEIDADFVSAEAAAQQEALRQQVIDENIALYETGAELQGLYNDKVLNHFDLNGSILQNIPSLIDDRFIQFTLYADGVEVFNTVYTESGVYRLPSGYKSQDFSVQLAGNIELRYIKMAESMKELKTL
tara:strand:+ start:11125 stop:12954 length:1830 start_codon:yes stop_codon:yes gene_type:complete